MQLMRLSFLCTLLLLNTAHATSEADLLTLTPLQEKLLAGFPLSENDLQRELLNRLMQNPLGLSKEQFLGAIEQHDYLTEQLFALGMTKFIEGTGVSEHFIHDEKSKKHSKLAYFATSYHFMLDFASTLSQNLAWKLSAELPKRSEMELEITRAVKSDQLFQAESHIRKDSFNNFDKSYGQAISFAEWEPSIIEHRSQMWVRTGKHVMPIAKKLMQRYVRDLQSANESELGLKAGIAAWKISKLLVMAHLVSDSETRQRIEASYPILSGKIAAYQNPDKVLKMLHEGRNFPGRPLFPSRLETIMSTTLMAL